MARAHSRVMLTNGTLPSTQLNQFSAVHPFTQQLDIVFPASDELERALTSLKPAYYKKCCTLSDFFEFASNSPGRNITALPSTSECADTWCIDPRGVLTLCVSKSLYEQLGLIGKKLPFKGCPEQYVIRIPVRQETESVAVRVKQKAALKFWDELREEGLGKWKVLYCQTDVQLGTSESDEVVIVQPQICPSADILIPVPALTPIPEESTEDWDERIGDLFEWVGMACLGAQRLKANDRVNPYVAVYEVPAPSYIGDVTRITWAAFLHQSFVKDALDTVTSYLASATDKQAFVAITRQGCCTSPVGAIPDASFDTARDPPLRVPEINTEDTGCFILGPGQNGNFVLAQSIGQWDARWG
ncbi:ribonuclease P 40kDa subunit-domain-containing protein [Suillus discolor]|uniref:Ribonuclease P 40kDa subunit-domain-containing protein n=1 Tax=Suillus discolor TaxID=1912936 RepID=A0A9P7F266_9AGAM|nr:ribonuclease P 40kDa subunit-domain-containing protein [Suillus discolor]KAG2103143.1 ribonuclease P 40kDa subunit-domain-containing protein [Suillus discolor]